VTTGRRFGGRFAWLSAGCLVGQRFAWLSAGCLVGHRFAWPSAGPPISSGWPVGPRVAAVAVAVEVVRVAVAAVGAAAVATRFVVAPPGAEGGVRRSDRGGCEDGAVTTAAPIASAGDTAGEASRPWALICGGGTAGHVIPAIAIGRALVARGHRADSIQFLGARRGIESRLVPAAGFHVTLLPGRGLQRRLTFANVRSAAGLVAAAVEGVALVARHRPAVIVSVGGYASLPGVVASALLRVPLVVVEQNAAAGAANRLAARVARSAAVAFPGTGLPRAVLTGNPVRQEVLAVDRSPAGRATARRSLGLPAGATVVVAFGGSLGARTINQAVLGLAELWRHRTGVAIYHVVGTRDWELMTAARPSLPDDGLWYRQVRYEEHMEVVYAAADIAVCRAGASTVAELAVVELPAVLVPLPGAPNDHQTANARGLVDAGAARLVADGEASAERLAAELEPLMDASTRAAMAAQAASVAHRQAAVEVAELVEQASAGHD
jgi:UDP-N-acetylglucosamine--N-acetylmuramyl-(pentapeptide) pyrophosphoryl-undecaprenol N-acetylglucosamine transferase